jgi:hypothetical protein
VISGSRALVATHHIDLVPPGWRAVHLGEIVATRLPPEVDHALEIS